MYELVEFIVTSLIGSDEKYSIEYIENEGLINIYVSKTAIGKIIGKQGRIAKAIRTLVRASANLQNKRVIVDIV